MNLSEALDGHRDICEWCQRGDRCHVAELLIERLTASIFPTPGADVIDFDGHRRECKQCRTTRLCSVGQDMHNRWALALIDGVDRPWGKRPGERKA